MGKSKSEDDPNSKAGRAEMRQKAEQRQADAEYEVTLWKNCVADIEGLQRRHGD